MEPSKEAFIEKGTQENKDLLNADDAEDDSALYYGVNDVPRPFTALLFGFQQVMVCSSALVVAPLLVAELICAQHLGHVRVQLVSTMLFLSGVATLLQVTLGVRLPVIQGGSFAFLPAIVVFGKIYPCPVSNCEQSASASSNCTANINSINDIHSDGMFGLEEPEWQKRILMIQGSLLAAALCQFCIGFFGLIGVLTRYIGPLTIAPLMVCLQLSVMPLCVESMSKSPISLLCLGAMLVAALYCARVTVPIPNCTKPKYHSKKPIFSMFSYLIAIISVWIFCIILTTTNVLPVGDSARTDLRQSVIHDAPWFRVPYPLQWGSMRFNTGMFLGFFAASLASIVESVGDYYATARACKIMLPVEHAVSRGIMIEGFMCMVAAVFGTGISLTTYSEIPGVIGITKVASRRTLQYAGCLLVLGGLFTKLGGIIAAIPDPIVGAVLFFSCSVLGGVGLSSLTAVDMKLSRNMAILGLAISAGVATPVFIRTLAESSAQLQNADPSFSSELYEALKTLLQIEMFVAGLVGFLLDNTVPGASHAERGLVFKKVTHVKSGVLNISDDDDIYDYPQSVKRILYKVPGIRFLPFMPPLL